jgi:hypothetical protein
LLAKEAVRLGVLCRLSGGDYHTAIGGVELARSRGWLSCLRAAEVAFALRCWFRIKGKIPAMAWLNHRFTAAGAS